MRGRPSKQTPNEDIIKYRLKYPEKYEARKVAQHLPKEDGFLNHHWSYNTDHYKDTIKLSKKDHKKVHKYLRYDQEKKTYKSIDGDILDTREKHVIYIKCVINFLPDLPGKLPKVEYQLELT